MDPLVHWLLTEGRFAPGPAWLLSELARRLCEDGFELRRMNLQPMTLHPEIEMMVHVWRRTETPSEMAADAPLVEAVQPRVTFGLVQEMGFGHGGMKSAAFRASPIFAIFHGAPRVRARIEPGATEFAYPILRDLAQVGTTDYVAWPLKLSDGTVCSFSVTTQLERGFSDAQLERLEGLLDPLAMCFESHVRARFVETLLGTYLGRGPGEAVLAGRVRRGDVEHVEAAIWFSDLRGFTQASASVAPTELVAWLNDYFGTLAKPLTDLGGEILKFIGDAVLAIFPVGPQRSAQIVCEAAVAAAGSANSALDSLNKVREAQGLPQLAHGIGLHFGEVLYGNIGAERRLDFTVIGEAVNLASRIESLCGKLGQRALASEALVTHLGRELPLVGVFELKGIALPRKVYRL